MRASLLVALSVAFALPAHAQAPYCKRWTAQVCGDEATSTQYISVASPVGQAIALLDFESSETSSFSISSTTSAGDGALVAIVSLVKLAESDPDVAAALVGLLLCGDPLAEKCAPNLAQLRHLVTRDMIMQSSLWGHACAHARDSVVQKKLAGLHLDGLYAAVAMTEASSTAWMKLAVERETPWQGTQTRCGQVQSGSVGLAIGSHVGTKIGTIQIDAQPSGAGTLTNVQLVAGSAVLRGSYTLSTTNLGDTADVLFTGDVVVCPALQALGRLIEPVPPPQ